MGTLSFSLITPPVALQDAPGAVLVQESCQTLLVQYGRLYGLSEAKIDEAVQTMRRESGFNEKASNPHDSDGGSWGCAQINIGKNAHPNITKEQAMNKYFASAFMAREFSLGNESKWTCWREWYGGQPKKFCPQK